MVEKWLELLRRNARKSWIRAEKARGAWLGWCAGDWGAEEGVGLLEL